MIGDHPACHRIELHDGDTAARQCTITTLNSSRFTATFLPLSLRIRSEETSVIGKGGVGS